MHTLRTSHLLADLLRFQSGRGRGAGGLWLGALSIRWVSRLAGTALAWKMARMTRQHVTHALILKGVLADLGTPAAPPPWIDAPEVDTIIDTLESSEQSHLRVRAVLLGLAPKVKAHQNSVLEQALGALIAANADAFEASQDLRWELMELQVDADLQAGRVHRFASAKDAIAFLHGDNASA